MTEMERSRVKVSGRMCGRFSLFTYRTVVVVVLALAWGCDSSGGNTENSSGGNTENSSGGNTENSSGGNTDTSVPDEPVEGATQNSALDAACTPGVTLNIKDQAGFTQFKTVSGASVEAFIQGIGQKVCRILYRHAEEVREATHLTLVIEDIAQENVPAYKAGNGAQITVGMDGPYLLSLAPEKLKNEVFGMLFHEMTHMYQNDDADGKGVPSGLIEGIADFVRITAGYHGPETQQKGGQWDSGYTTTGWFLIWLEQRYPDVVYKLNLSMDSHDGLKWSPAAFKGLIGSTVDDLWVEYQLSL